MPQKKLTDAAVKRLKQEEPGRGIEYFDLLLPGFGLRITPKGTKSFVLFTRVRGKQRRITIGRYPRKSLQEARDEARDILKQISKGIDPREQKEKEQREAERQEAERAEAEQNAVEVVVAEWLQRDQSKNRGHDGLKKLFEKDVTPRWKGKQISEITKSDVLELLDAIRDRGSFTMARRVRAHLHRMFRWCVEHDKLETSPMAFMPKQEEENQRDRFLNDAELARVWHASGSLGYPLGPVMRLLILTGARMREIAALRWEEVDLDGAAILLEKERTKNGKPRVIPLSPLALAIISKAPRVQVGEGKNKRDSEFVFTTTGETYSGVGSKQKKRVDEEAAKLSPAGDKLAEPKPVAAWRTHDLRRTVATDLQRLGVRLEVTEAVLGHISGRSRSGIVGVYQRHEWAGEKREALEAWARFVELISTQAGAALARKLDGKSAERSKFQQAITQDGAKWKKYLRSHSSDSA
jgi:integrase